MDTAGARRHALGEDARDVERLVAGDAVVLLAEVVALARLVEREVDGQVLERGDGGRLARVLLRTPRVALLSLTVSVAEPVGLNFDVACHTKRA